MQRRLEDRINNNILRIDNIANNFADSFHCTIDLNSDNYINDNFNIDMNLSCTNSNLDSNINVNPMPHITLINARSTKKKMKSIIDHIETLNIDCAFVSETWETEKQDFKVTIEEKDFRTFRAFKGFFTLSVNLLNMIFQCCFGFVNFITQLATVIDTFI